MSMGTDDKQNPKSPHLDLTRLQIINVKYVYLSDSMTVQPRYQRG